MFAGNLLFSNPEKQGAQGFNTFISKTMDSGVLAFVAIGAMVVFIIWYYIRTNSYVANDQEFKQNGVRVVFADRTITIGKRTYSVDKVKGIRWERVANSSHVTIEVDDFDKPIHKIGVVGPKGAEVLQQRICTALRKANGPSFV